MNVYTALRMTDDLSSRMLDHLHFWAKTNPQGSTARTNNGRGGGTHGALVRRGLVGLGVNERGRAGYFLTPKAWAYLRHMNGTVRPADADRLTLDEALAEAYPAEQALAPAAPRSGEVVVPGALADHLTAEPPADADTRATLDAARRGRGRTLIIKPRTVAVLHTISRAAEHLLDTPGTSRTQRTSACQWIERAGRAPAPVPVTTNAFEQGNPVEDDGQADGAGPLSPDDLTDTVICPTCHVAIGARCITRSGKPAREPHGRRFEALEQAAGITKHRAAARREAEARGGWVIALDHKAEGDLLTAYAARINAAAEARLDHVEAEATEATWQGAWISEHQAADALFDGRAAQ